MNVSKTNEILKDIKSSNNDIYIGVTECSTTLSTNNDTLTNIYDNLVDIGVTLRKEENKKIFSAYLMDGSNAYLTRDDYTGGNEEFFAWTNNLGKTAYITRYDFVYIASPNPAPTDLYHSSSFTTRIGLLNESGDEFDENYIQYKQNVEYPQSNGLKRTLFSPTAWTWHYRFNEISTPIPIEASRQFGHHINGDFQSSEGYDSDPIGIIYGYYYDN